MAVRTANAGQTQDHVFVSSSEGSSIWRFEVTGEGAPIKVGGLNTPEGIACGPDARLFIAESALF